MIATHISDGYLREIINIFLAGQVSRRVENFIIAIFDSWKM